MINPLGEFRGFVHAALVQPVERDHTDPDDVFVRRRVVSVLTLLLGGAVLAWSLRIPPGDPRFYLGTTLLALVWFGGAVLSGPLHLGRSSTRAGHVARPVVQSLVLGLVLLGIFLVGALAVAQVPVLRRPVEGLLDHASIGSLTLVALLTAVNGIAEEVYFRGALYSAIGRRQAVLATTLVYTLVSAASGIALLALAAAALGLVTGLQRRVTGGVLGPILTHLTWSLGMLLLLPPTLGLAS